MKNAAAFWLKLDRTDRSVEAMKRLLNYHETILKSVEDKTRREQVELLKKMIAEKERAARFGEKESL